MWSICDNKKIRHIWGDGGKNGKIKSLCGLDGELPLDYVTGIKYKKCCKCQKEYKIRKEDKR